MTPASKKQAGAELALCSFAFISPTQSVWILLLRLGWAIRTETPMVGRDLASCHQSGGMGGKADPLPF